MEGLIQLSYLPTQSRMADVLTKILPSQQHWTLLDKLGMLPQHSKLEGCVGSLHLRSSKKKKRNKGNMKDSLAELARLVTKLVSKIFTHSQCI